MTTPPPDPCPQCGQPLHRQGVDNTWIPGLWWCQNCQSHAKGTPPTQLIHPQEAKHMTLTQHLTNVQHVRRINARRCGR